MVGKANDENPMAKVFMDKVIINIGTGNDDQKQEKAKMLLSIITGSKPVDEISRKRIPQFKITKGTKIGAFVTIRNNPDALVKRLLEAVDNKLKESSISANTASFGINEYIDISGVKYDPNIGMLGMNVNMSFKRKGTRVSLRKRKPGDIPKKHKMVAKEDIKKYLEERFKVQITS